jgi:hypothetical protein
MDGTDCHVLRELELKVLVEERRGSKHAGSNIKNWLYSNICNDMN